MLPVVLAEGQTNWPCSSRLVSMHRPTPSCQISPARLPRKAKTAAPNGSSAKVCCTSVASPVMPSRMSVTRMPSTPAGRTLARSIAVRRAQHTAQCQTRLGSTSSISPSGRADAADDKGGNTPTGAGSTSSDCDGACDTTSANLTLPAVTSIAALLAASPTAGGRIKRDYQQLKGKIGLGNYEVEADWNSRHRQLVVADQAGRPTSCLGRYDLPCGPIVLSLL